MYEMDHCYQVLGFKLHTKARDFHRFSALLSLWSI